MEIDEILEKAKHRLDARKSELKQLEHERKAYIVDQVKKKFPGAIFDNGDLSEQTPKDIYCDAVRFAENRSIPPEGHISLDPVFKEMTDKIHKIEREVLNATCDLCDASEFTGAANTLKDKLLLKEKLIYDLKGLKGKIDHIDSDIDGVRAKYFSSKKKLDDLKELIG